MAEGFDEILSKKSEHVADADVEDAGVVIFDPVEFALERQAQVGCGIVSDACTEIEAKAVDTGSHIVARRGINGGFRLVVAAP